MRTSQSTSVRSLAYWWPLISLAAILLVIGGMTAWAGDGQTKQIVAEMMIRIVVVVGMYIFIGNSGILSFGHISFMAIGAYAAAWFICCTLPMVKPLYLPDLPEFLKDSSYPFGVGVASAIVLTGLVSFAIGAVLMRLSGIAATIATFALLAITASVYGNWEGVTGGSSSISNIPVNVGPWIATAFAILILLIAFIHQTSRFGLMLRATRDDAVAARSSGISAFKVKLIAFVVSAICVGIGGALYASFLGILTIDAFYFSITFMTLAMLIVGGMRSLAGAVIGVLFVTAITEIFRFFENGVSFGDGAMWQLPRGLQEVSLGIIIVLVLIFRPGGLMNGREIPIFGRRIKDVATQSAH